LKKLITSIILIIISGQLIAQSSVPQIALGAGGGLAQVFAGTQSKKTTLSFYGDASYYPVSGFDVNIEEQSGLLSGISLNKKDGKSFNNNYSASLINIELQARAGIGPDITGFLDFVRNVYAGIGYGIINSNIINVNVTRLNTYAHIRNRLPMVPLKLGYELNIVKNSFDEPLLKLDGCLNFNYVKGKGIDGYYDELAAPYSFYTCGSLGLRYVFSLRHSNPTVYNKFD
jgi:hypothetical protein